MELLSGGYTLEIPPLCFPLSTDSVALAGFVRPGGKGRCLDLGSGCGTLGMLLCAGDPNRSVTGIEADPVAHKAALSNIARNRLEDRLESLLADIRDVPGLLEAGSFSICVSNPPYFSGGPESRQLPTARREDQCPPEALMRAAAWALKYGGDFYLVHRPERLAQLCALGSAQGLEAKDLCLVRHRPQDPVSLILLRLRKGGKPGLNWEEWHLHEADGSPSSRYRELYHL